MSRGPDGAAFHAHRLFPVLLFAFGIAAWATLQASPGGARLGKAGSAALKPRLAHFSSGLKSLLPDRSLVPMAVEDVVEHQPGNLEAILLVDEKSRYVLPIFVEPSEGEAVRRALSGGLFSGMVTHELIDEVVRSLGAEVERVEVRADEGLLLRAEVVLRVPGRGGDPGRIVLDARPGDALALALASRSPVYTTGRVLEEQGIPRTRPALRSQGDIPSPLKPPESL